MAKIAQKIHQIVEQRANGCCEYCKYLQKYTPIRFDTEHIIPKARGGSDELDNLAKACKFCNGGKYTAVSATDPITLQTVPLFHPRQDDWNDHFEWSEDFLLIIGKTAIGRATIERLNMNNEGIVNLREIAIGVGHPPD